MLLLEEMQILMEGAEKGYEEAMEILSENDWSQRLVQVKETKQRVYDLF